MAPQSRALGFICDRCISRLPPTPLSTTATRLAALRNAQSTRSKAAAYSTTIRPAQSASPIRASTTTLNCRTKQRPAVPSSAFQYSTSSSSLASEAATTASTNTSPNPPSESALEGLIPSHNRLPHRKLIQVSGPDAPKFLQGLITHHVDGTTSDSFFTAFLDARGRVICEAFVWVDGQGQQQQYGGGGGVGEGEGGAGKEWSCYIEVDEGVKEGLVKHLKRHKLRAKVQIEEPKEEYSIEVCLGVPVHEVQDSLQPVLEKLKKSGSDPLLLADPRAPQMGTRVLFRDQAADDNIPGLNRSSSVYDAYRYSLGIPEGPKEIIPGTSLPMECNFDLFDAIDWRKGCYVGQELTIRTKHTGVVRKRILPVDLFVPEGAELDSGMLDDVDIRVLGEDGKMVKGGRPVGRVLRNVDGRVGLAVCRLEAMTPIRVTAEGGSWRPGMRFGVEVQGRGVVEVVPRLPGWLVEREREIWGKGREKRVVGKGE